MNTFFRKITVAAIIAAITIIFGCDKRTVTQPTTNTKTPTENYSSMADFFAKNGVVAQTYTVTNSTGGSFTTAQGTVVTIPANTFVNSLYQLVPGTVTITFKDIYKKSDMLLSNMPTNMIGGAPLKSGGEFFIKATSGGNAVILANVITVKQPLNAPMDSAMLPFIDSTAWARNNYSAGLTATYSNYIFSLYQFSFPVDSGTWCNSDNPYYFSAYTQTNLTLQESDNPADYSTYVFLIFKGINAMVHVYNGHLDAFPYSYAPEGLQCTVVAVGVKGGTVYSSFTPITISKNQTVNFTMTATTTAAFKSALSALN